MQGIYLREIKNIVFLYNYLKELMIERFVFYLKKVKLSIFLQLKLCYI